MVVRNFGSLSSPWFDKYKERIYFEKNVYQYFPDMTLHVFREKQIKKIQYSLYINVPYYNKLRHVTITFSSSKDSFPLITTDGSTNSPHRYEGKYLCIWYPWDPKENRWLFTDGLLSLISLIQIHLFKEAWWRENDEWLGPEIKHNSELVNPE